MKYLCLGYHEEQAWASLPPAQRDALLEETLAYRDWLSASGYLIDDHGLQSAAAATTLRFDSGQMSITDGPFAETKEQLGGIMLLEANDLNQAIQLASKIPCMRVGGSLELRPINTELSSGRRPTGPARDSAPLLTSNH
jgi:hypothetical protein